jgi:hypothetical protein
LDPVKHRKLAEVVDQLRKRKEKGEAFCGMPYEKIKIWADLPLRDKRMKPMTEKKVIKTFRLDPKALARLKIRAQEENCSETEILEKLLNSC